MHLLPTQPLLYTLRAIDDLNREGWTELNGFNPEPCLQAGWIVAHSKGYRLTGSGEGMLRMGASPHIVERATTEAERAPRPRLPATMGDSAQRVTQPWFGPALPDVAGRGATIAPPAHMSGR